MTSQTDLDQGGTFRTYTRQYMGPSVGWIDYPFDNVLPITQAGTYQIQPGTTLVTLNVNGSVVLTLPSANNPSVTAGVLPRLFVPQPITIVDIGGFCQANPATINPFSGSENVMGLTTIQLATNYGGYTLSPSSAQHGWTSISP